MSPLKKLLLTTAVLVLVTTPTFADSLLVSNSGTDQVLKYDLATGTYIGVFADASTLVGVAATGGTLLNEPTGMDIGPDGNVYVGYRDGLGSASTGGILRFSPDGTFIDVFSTAVGNIQDLDFGSDGNLYVNQYSSGVYCILGPDDASAGLVDPTHTAIGNVKALEPYDNPETGTLCYFRSIIDFGGQVRLSSKSGSTLAVLTGPWSSDEDPYGLEFGPDGRLYCATNNGIDPDNINIYVFDPSTIDYSGGQGAGSFTLFADGEDASPAVRMPLGIVFDGNNLLVANYSGCIAEYDSNGDYVGNRVAVGEGGLSTPHFGLAILPEAANVPEPSTVMLLLSGLCGLLVWRRKK